MKLPRALLPGKRSARYVDAADALRVIATALVAAYHIWQQSWINLNIRLFGMNVNLRPLVSTGYLGVEMLLMLSGFLLYLPYANGQEAPARTFYRKRAARILPSYWFCILIMLFAFALPQHKYASGGALAKDLIAHATFTHNLFPETYFATPLNGAMWTLAVEVQFYVLAPLICRFFRKKPAIAYAGMVLIAAAYRYLYVLPMEDTTYFMNRLPNLLDVYANGMLLAHIYARLSRKRQKPWQAWAATAISLLAIVLMYLLAHSQSRISGYELSRRGQMARRFAFSALGGMFLVFGSRSVRMMRALYSNRAVRFLSAISLNFYIWHQVLALKLKEWHIPAYSVDLPQQNAGEPWRIRYTAICWLAAFIAATMVTYLIERPAAKWIARGREEKRLRGV